MSGTDNSFWKFLPHFKYKCLNDILCNIYIFWMSKNLKMNQNDDFGTYIHVLLFTNFCFYLLKAKILSCKHIATPSDVNNDNWWNQNKTENDSTGKWLSFVKLKNQKWKVKEIFYVKSRGEIKQRQSSFFVKWLIVFRKLENESNRQSSFSSN